MPCKVCACVCAFDLSVSCFSECQHCCSSDEDAGGSYPQCLFVHPLHLRPHWRSVGSCSQHARAWACAWVCVCVLRACASQFCCCPLCRPSCAVHVLLLSSFSRAGASGCAYAARDLTRRHPNSCSCASTPKCARARAAVRACPRARVCAAVRVSGRLRVRPRRCAVSGSSATQGAPGGPQTVTQGTWKAPYVQPPDRRSTGRTVPGRRTASLGALLSVVRGLARWRHQWALALCVSCHTPACVDRCTPAAKLVPGYC